MPLVDAGQRLVDGLFGEKSGIRVRTGTREEIARGVEALGIRSEEDCDRYGIVPERPVVDAITVVNEGSEALKSAATEGTVGRAWAAECAEKLGKKSLGEASERAQATALDMIAGKLPPEEATAAMEAIAELAARKPDYTDREAADAIRAARARAVGRVAVDADSEMVEMPDGTIKSVAEAKAEGAAQAQEAAAEGKTVDESGWLPKAPAAPGADKAAEPTVKADGSVGCVRFEGAKATRTRSEDGREIVLIEGMTGEEMMRPENRDAAVQFVTRLKEMAGDVDLVFADVSAADAAEALLMAARVRARAEARSVSGDTIAGSGDLVAAGQRLVDGLFGEKSGIRVRTGTREEAEAALRAAGETKPIKDAEGQVQGYYDRGKGEVVLFEGADAGTLAHEIGWHAVRHWAERNSPDLLLKMNRYAARAPMELKAAIKEAYGDFTGDALLDEIGAGRFERTLGERFKALLAEKPEVRSWWRKVLHAVARAWKGLARTVGGNRVDLKKIEKMDPEEAIEALTAQMLEGRRLGEGRGNAEGDIRYSRKQMNALAKSKVGEWVEGTSADGIRNAVEKRIQEGMPEGEYRFKNAEDRSRLVRGAVKFYKRFAQKTVMLSDGRCVYFVPDARARERGLTNEEAWAEYAIHAVTSSGKPLDGKGYNERLYNASKAQNIWRIENILKAERCEAIVENDPQRDSVVFFGRGIKGDVVRIVTRLDERGNVYADLSEVTMLNGGKMKKLPPRKPLTEVVETVVNRRQRGGLLTADAQSISQQGGGAQGEIRPSIKKREEREKGVGAQTDSQQFKRWFADSKVVDENGEPLVVYRRDNEAFNVFDVNKTQQNDAGWLGKGFYFYGDRREAESATGYGKNLRKFYLKAENPYYITQEEYNRLVEADDPRVSAEFAKRLTEEGYDSVYWNGDGRKEWMVLEPTQIKSATDNIGTFDPGNPDIRYSRAPRKTKEEEKFAAAVGGLTARGKDGTLAAVDQKRLTAVMRGLGSGELKHPRFTREEAAASGGTEHERLWNYILSLESPDIHAGGAEAVGGGEGGADPQGGGWLGRLRRMATRYEGDPKEIAAGEHKYLDRGAESSVYDAGDGTVVKVRKLPLNSADGVKEALAKLVYHNYLFPKDAYTLRDIAVWDNNGYDQFYLILEQPLVTPKTDAAGNIVAPSEGQIFEALKKANRRFRMHDEALERRAEDEFDTTDGDGSSADFVPSARKIAYTDQFVVYDFKPGRNTFIDAETGEVRFIDPRVEVNDPGAGFSVSRFGKRKSVNGTASFEGAPSGEMEGVRYSRRGGKRRDEVYDDVLKAVRAGGQRVAAGRSERTEAGFDAGAALWMEREGQMGKSQDGSMTLSYSEALRLYRAMSASAHMPKVLEKMPHLATRDRKGRLRLNAAAFGIVDKSDLEAVKAGLKKDGMFLHEDPSWRLHNDFEEVRAMKEMSEQALAEEMEGLAEARITGKMSGGGRTAVNILAKEIGRIACELPVTAGAPQSLKDLRKLGLGIAKELGDPKGELGKEAREAARWWREQDPVRKDPTATKSEDIAESELWAEMFGMFLADPMALQERAPNVYGKMVEAIAGNEKLAEAWNGLRRTRDAEGPHERVMRDIERQWDVNEQQAYKELLAELDKPIGKWGKRTRARLLLELHSAEGPAVMWVTDAVRERLAELKRLKKAGKIGEEEYDLLAGGAKRELEKMRVALLHKQRGGGTGRLYALDFASGVMEDVARDGVDMGDLRRYMYAKSVRDGLHQKGKAAALGMDQREAQKVLEELEGRLGADGWAKLETAAKRFQATREQHLLENEFVLEAFGKDLVNYWKMNASYVRSERTWTAEEVAAYEAARSDWMARHPGESTVIAEIEALMDMHVAKGSGTAGSSFLKPLAGSLKAVKDPIAATLENDLRIIEFAQRNHWACQLAESAKALEMEGFAVMEDRGGGGKLRGSNRYGSVTFLKDGKRMTLVMPKVVAEGFEHDSRGVSKLVKLNRWASAILTQYSPRFALRNIWRNRASNANNIAWMGEGRLVTGMGMVGMRPVARLATFLLERAAAHLPDRFARNALMNVLYGSKTNLYWEAEATRLAKMMQDPQLLRRRAEEANSLMLQGKSAEAQRLWDDIQRCQEFMKLPIFAGVRKQIMGESGKTDLDELMRSLNLETNFDGTKLTGLKRAKRWMQRRAETVKRFNDFEEARVKLIALLAAQHEAELAQARGEAAPRSRDEITYQVATMSGSPRYENRGRAMNYIEFACGPFMNVGMKGAWRTVESMRYDPKSWWTKAAGRIAGRLATYVLWMGGGYKVLSEILRESAGEDEEKKKRVDAFERFGKRMAHALANVSDYRLRNYDIVPVGLYGKWSTLAISMPRGDEDRLLMPTVDLLANGMLGSEKAQEMGFALPTDLNYTGSQAVQNTVLNSGLVPDLTRRGLLMSLFQDAIGPLVGCNPYNTFTQRTVYSEADFESRFADPGNMASKVGKQLWNDVGGQVVMPATTWDEDEGAYDDQGQWALSGAEEGEAGCMPIGGKTIFRALHSIPFLSAAASGLITFQNGGNERIARRLEKYRRDDSAPLRAAAQRVADEVIEAVRANGEDFDYSEMLAARVSELGLPEEDAEIIEGLAFKKVQGIAAKMGSEFDPIGKTLRKMSNDEKMYRRAKRQVEAEGWDGDFD